MSHLDESFWDNRYITNNIGWDLGTCSPPLKAYFDQIEDKNLRILIPGCGNSYEATYLLEQGFKNVFILDISEKAIASFKEKNPSFPEQQIFNGNFFDHNETYDLIVEQTFFCAIDPKLRNAYAEKSHELLTDNGKLIGVLFNREFDGGPPFGGSIDEYQKTFGEMFDILIMEPCHNSIEPRSGAEIFISFRKK